MGYRIRIPGVGGKIEAKKAGGGDSSPNGKEDRDR
jgi:hypothetical protein